MTETIKTPDQLPTLLHHITKDIIKEALSGLNESSITMRSLLSTTNNDIAQLRDMITSMQTQYNTLEARITQSQQQSTKAKGTEGELRLYHLLTDRLLTRDGYTVTHIAGRAHACDIIVKHESHPNIRIECKAHGEHNGMKVNSSEVAKFKRDLQETNDHGIFISFHTAIAGISSGIDIHQLPTGKFAFFISNQSFDADLVVTCMHLIYKLHKWTTDRNESVCISSDTLLQIKTLLLKQAENVSDIKRRLRESLDILNTMNLSGIETLLLGNKVDDKKSKDAVVVQKVSNEPVLASMESSATSPVSQHIPDDVCPWCKKTFNGAKGVALHQGRCWRKCNS